MADMQMFPDTVEEFMEQNKMVDTEEVYSNGIEYVPIFRMEQWFEHERAKHPERRKGLWLDDEGKKKENGYCGYCSVCGDMSEYLTDYCPHCGADMREKEENF